MACEVVGMKVAGRVPLGSTGDEMTVFLQMMANLRQFIGLDVTRWGEKVHVKLQSIVVDTVQETVAGVVMLNCKLSCTAGFSMMHH
jgi:hypothetical protein